MNVYRVPTGQGKLEKVREFEWSSGKGHGKILFFGKIGGKSGKMKYWCHQMSDFEAKMHQIRFRLGLPQTLLGELTALPQTP